MEIQPDMKYDIMSSDMDNRKFSEWLLDELKQRGWSQAELARRAGINRQNVSAYLSSKIAKPDENQLIRIAGALNMPPERVYRAAGILPKTSQDQSDLEEWREILSYLSTEEREELRRIGWLKIDLRRQAELKKEIEKKRGRE